MITGQYGSIIDMKVNDKLDSQKMKLTEEVLRCIASHVDSKMSRVVITVGIAEFEDSFSIAVYPYTQVYPDIHRRKAVDLQDVEDHVVMKHFPELIQSVDEAGRVSIKSDQLIPGIYHYVFSSTGKQRHWIRHGESL